MDMPQMNPALLSRLLPGAELEVLEVHQGQCYQVVVGADRAVCLPLTLAAAARLPRRAATLHILAELDLGVCTPRPLSMSDAEEAWLVLSRVPGAPLGFGAVENSEVAEVIATQYVRLLTRLAKAGADDGTRAVLSVPEGRWSRFAGEVRAELYGLMSDDGRLRAERELAAVERLPEVETGVDAAPWDDVRLGDVRPAVVHGDLGAENVLWEWIDGLPRLGGVVDWDQVTIGDQAEDLAAIAASFGTDFLDRVLRLGGWDSIEVRDRIAAIRGTFALQQALMAYQDEDEAQLDDGLAGYRG